MDIKLTTLDARSLERQSPYTNLKCAAQRDVEKWQFIILVYGAFNAMGLIGSEKNGIAVLEKTGRQVVLDEHLIEGCGVNAKQIREFERLCKLPDAELLEFINAHPRTRQQYLNTKQLRAKAAKLWVPKVTVVEPPAFTPTECYTAEDKANFAKAMMRLIAKDFRPTIFTQAVYSRLNGCFSHIAHYNRNGFYGTWFETPEKRLEWLKYMSDHGCWGAPQYTFCDVERFLIKWVRDNHLIRQYMERVHEAREAAELAQARKLAAKYPEVRN